MLASLTTVILFFCIISLLDVLPVRAELQRRVDEDSRKRARPEDSQGQSDDEGRQRRRLEEGRGSPGIHLPPPPQVPEAARPQEPTDPHPSPLRSYEPYHEEQAARQATPKHEDQPQPPPAVRTQREPRAGDPAQTLWQGRSEAVRHHHSLPVEVQQHVNRHAENLVLERVWRAHGEVMARHFRDADLERNYPYRDASHGPGRDMEWDEALIDHVGLRCREAIMRHLRRSPHVAFESGREALEEYGRIANWSPRFRGHMRDGWQREHDTMMGDLEPNVREACRQDTLPHEHDHHSYVSEMTEVSRSTAPPFACVALVLYRMIR